MFSDSVGIKRTHIAKALADVLTTLSWDLVVVVASYLVHRSATPDAKAHLAFAFGKFGKRDGDFCFACDAIAANHQNGEFWVASADGRVQAFDEARRFLFRLTPSLNTPFGIVFDGTEAFVVDYEADCVCVYGLDGQFRRKFGTHGAGDEQFNGPAGIAVDGQGRIFVSDSRNNCVKVFDRTTGKFLWKFGSVGAGDGQFDCVRGLALTAAGEIVVADAENSRIQIFDRNGKLLRKFGCFGNGAGQFQHPVNVAICMSGNIICADRYSSKVQIFQPDGTFLTSFQCSSIAKVCSVAVCGRNRILVGMSDSRVVAYVFSTTAE